MLKEDGDIISVTENWRRGERIFLPLSSILYLSTVISSWKRQKTITENRERKPLVVQFSAVK